jgi:hypothetical protein
MLLGGALVSLMPAKAPAATATITATNPADVACPSYTVTVPWSDLAAILGAKTRADRVIVKDADAKPIVCQPIFFHGTKQPAEELVFQADFGAGETKTFTIEPGLPAPYDPKVYGRWVPEREDDFGWENDRIAYRIYGPKLEIDEPAGSGVDVWPKRTTRLIINKWYQLAQSINGAYYHTDHGEGLDCYKVGKGQGCGGTALWLDGKRLTTGIHGWKTQTVIANGPVRMMFELTYAPIDVNGVGVSETKRITLDAGQSLNHYQSTFTADKPVANLAVLSGIVEHQDRPYHTQMHKDEGWMTYWDAGDGPGETKPPASAPDGHVGCAVVMPAAQVSDTFEADHNMEMSTAFRSAATVDFWAGAGWDKSGFADYAAWNAYVGDWAKRIGSPLKVSVAGK